MSSPRSTPQTPVIFLPSPRSFPSPKSPGSKGSKGTKGSKGSKGTQSPKAKSPKLLSPGRFPPGSGRVSPGLSPSSQSQHPFVAGLNREISTFTRELEFVDKQRDWLLATAIALSKKQINAAGLLADEIEEVADALVHVELSGQGWGVEAEEAFQSAQDIVLLYISESMSKLDAKMLLKQFAKTIRENRGAIALTRSAIEENKIFRGTKWLLSTTWRDLIGSIGILYTAVQSSDTVRSNLMENVANLLPEGASPLGYITQLFRLKADNLITANVSAPVRTLDSIVTEAAQSVGMDEQVIRFTETVQNNGMLNAATTTLGKVLNVEAQVGTRLLRSDLPQPATAADWGARARGELGIVFGARDSILILIGFLFLLIALILFNQAVIRPYRQQAKKGRKLRQEVVDMMKTRKGKGTFHFKKRQSRKTGVNKGSKVSKANKARKTRKSKTGKTGRKVRKSKVSKRRTT